MALPYTFTSMRIHWLEQPKPFVTVKGTPLLETPPTVTITLPEDAPEGTCTVMLVGVQFAAGMGGTLTPLTVTVLALGPVPCEAPKPAPLMTNPICGGPWVNDKGGVPFMDGEMVSFKAPETLEA